MSFQCLAVVLLSLVSLSYSQPPYLVSISRTGPFENNIILRCQVAATGLTVSGAVFTRNGALFHQDEECLQKIATDSNNGILNLNLTANCEGYYQCGEAGNGNRFELSGSTIVYGKYYYDVIIPIYVWANTWYSKSHSHSRLSLEKCS